jgi:glucokinase
LRFIVGVDLGGTNIVVGTLSEDGETILGQESRPTPVAEGAEAVIGLISKMVRGSIEAAKRANGQDIEIVGVGIGSPGPLSTKTGIVKITPNLKWRNVPLRQMVSDAAELPATLDNDANCAVLGEAWKGAARGAVSVVGLTVGTGIGGGIVLNNRVYHGASDVAGEFGHMTIDSMGRRCHCGNYGCLEAYASGPAIALRAVEAIESGYDSVITDQVGAKLHEITAQTVYDAAKNGDALAQEVVRDTARFLGAGVGNIINILNPEVFVICGGVTQAGSALFDPLKNEVKRRAFLAGVDACRIVPGELSGTAGVYGAVASFKIQRWEDE